MVLNIRQCHQIKKHVLEIGECLQNQYLLLFNFSNAKKVFSPTE
jgi:hypothetical protein